MLKSIFQGAGKVALGTAAGQGIVLLVTPFLARQYSPAEFGSLALLLTVSNISTALACGRFDLSLPTADKGEESSLFLVAVLAAVVSSFTLMAAFGVADSVLGSVWPSPFDNALLVGFCVFFVGVQQAVIGAMTHDRNYTGVGVVRLGQGGIFAVLASFPPVGLLFAHVLSFTVAVPYAVRRLFGMRISAVDVGRAASDRRDFPLLSLPGAIFDVVGYSTCVWIMVYFYGAAEGGQYSQIQRIVGAPLMLLGMSIGQVLMRTSVDAIDDRNGLSTLFRHVRNLAMFLGLSLVAVVAIVGEPFLHWLVGPQWRVDTGFIVPIAIAVTVRACVSPLSTLLVPLRRFDLALRWQITYFVSSALILTLAAINLSFEKFVYVYAIQELILYGLYLKLIAKAIGDVKCAASSV